MKKYRNILILFLVFFIVTLVDALAASDDSTAVAKISQVIKYIENNNRLVDQLDSSTFFNLPVGIKGKKLFNLCITEATIRPGGAVFTAVLQIDDPADPERKYTFTASNVPFSFKGGLQGTIRLALMNDVSSMPICKGVSLDVLKGSFVDWGCSGFERLKICADVDFSPGIFIPVNADGTDKANAKLSAYVEAEVQDLNDLAFKISLDDPFKIKGIPDLIFTCKDLVIDRSDYSNPSGIQFPSNYLSAYSSVNSNLWKGIYVGEASVKLGKLFADKSTNVRPSITVRHFIIDDNGLTGTVTADNILSLDQGSLGG
ncbi:MAG: hypothetical protein Q8907_15300, partial [Bacteroidota bacterium]|nr:hypothetical protein [Bacteroidota bacterium]